MSFPVASWWVAMDSRHKAVAGVAIAATVLTGVYAVAATTATSIAGRFTTTQAENRSRTGAVFVSVQIERAVPDNLWT